MATVFLVENALADGTGCGCADLSAHWVAYTGLLLPRRCAATSGEHSGEVRGVCVHIAGEGELRWVVPVCASCSARTRPYLVLAARARLGPSAACHG